MYIKYTLEVVHFSLLIKPRKYKREKMIQVALCFIISYEHTLNKEKIWREWIEPNKDIIRVYVHCKDASLVKSEWLKSKCLPAEFIMDTDYLHVVPAYMSLLLYGLRTDSRNQWFCFLTESCVPIISPLKFREKFLENYEASIMSWKKAWWNMTLVKRANLHCFNPDYHLAHSPWFILCRQDAARCIRYSNVNNKLYRLICQGDVANESVFAIMLHAQKRLTHVKNEDSTITDWSRMMTATSPYLFKRGDSKDKKFIEDSLQTKKYAVFLRKVDTSFPDDLLVSYIYRAADKDIKSRIFYLETKIMILQPFKRLIQSTSSNSFHSLFFIACFMGGFIGVCFWIYL